MSTPTSARARHAKRARRLRGALAALLTTLAALAGTLAVMAPVALASPPEAPETTPATGITASGATLHGVLNPGAPSEGGGYRFSFKPSPTECEPEGAFRPELPALALGKAKEAVSTVLTGLDPNREYTFCVVASNLSAEATTGQPKTFTTLGLPPVVDAENAASVNASGVSLEAQVNPNNEATGFVFEYAREATGEELEGTVITVPGGEPLPAQLGDATAAVPRIEGLAPGKMYFYRVVAENLQSEEESLPVKGPVKSFTTVPVPTTEAVTGVTATSATFHGNLAPLNAVDTTYSFDYRIGEAGCVGEGATTLEDAGTGSGTQAVSSEATGLQPNVTYSVCLVSSNVFGSEADPASPAVKFSTPAAPPKIDGESTSSLTPFSATLEALINANNETTSYTLEYADQEAKLGTPAATVFTGELAGFGDQGPAFNTGNLLTANTTYFYRATAESEQSKTEGKPVQGPTQSFTTEPALAPSVEGGSEHAAGIGSRTATFEAAVNADYQETTVVFEYAASEAGLLAGNGAKVEASAPLGPFGGAQGVGELAEGLTPATLYYLRVTATNASGTTHSPPVTFETLVVPLVEETLPEATEVTQGTALVTDITVNPQMEEPPEPGEEPIYYIAYGETSSYGQALPAAHGKAGYGMTGHEVPDVELSGLKPGTTYHYAVVAHNQNGTQTGADHQFTTEAPAPFTTPPAVGNSSAQFTSENSTVIEGEVDPEGQATSYQVHYGTTSSYGTTTPTQQMAGFMTAQGTITAITGLAANTVYHYRLTATNPAGTTNGPDRTFTTTGASQPGVFTPFNVPTTPPVTTPEFTFPPEEPVGTGPKPKTNRQKLAAALKVCARKVRHVNRKRCERKARARYGSHGRKAVRSR